VFQRDQLSFSRSASCDTCVNKGLNNGSVDRFQRNFEYLVISHREIKTAAMATIKSLAANLEVNDTIVNQDMNVYSFQMLALRRKMP
jgi:hypothetical protein